MRNKYFKTLIVLIVLFTFSSLLIRAEDNLFLQGINDYYNKMYKEAVEKFQEVLIEDENNIEALYYQTLSYLELKDIVKAKGNINLLAEKGYSFGMIHWKLGELYLNKDQTYDSPFYNEARKELEKAKSLGISSARLHSDLAMAYQGLGNLELAAEQYETAIKKGHIVSDYINLATIYKEAGKLDAALDLYAKALQNNPDNISIYINLGDIYLEKGEYTKAIDVLSRGLNLDSTMVAIRTNLALAYYHNRDYQKAIEEFRRVINENPNIYQAYYYLGEIYNGVEQNYELAINYYEQAISYNRSYVRAYLSLGDLYLKNEETYKAMAQYLKALEYNPEYPDAHFRLALAYIQMGMKEAAIEELRKTLHLDSSNNEARLLLNRLQGE